MISTNNLIISRTCFKSSFFRLLSFSFRLNFLFIVHRLSISPLHIYSNIFLCKMQVFLIKYFYFLQKKQKLRPAFNLLTLLFFLLSYSENVPHAVLQFFLLLRSLFVLFVPLLTLAISCLSLFLVPKRTPEKFRKKL